MKICENDRALTKRDLLTKLQKVLKALGTQSQRADAAERECVRLRAEVIRLSASRTGSDDPYPESSASPKGYGL